MFESNLKISKKLDAVKYPPTDINAEILKILKQSGFKNPKIIHVSHNSEAGNMQYFTQFSCDKQSEEKSSKALNKLRSYKKGKCYMTDCYYIAYTEYSKGECYYKTDYKKQEEKKEEKEGPFKDKSLVSKITSNYLKRLKDHHHINYFNNVSVKLIKSSDKNLVYNVSKTHPYNDYIGKNKAHGISKREILEDIKEDLYWTTVWEIEEKLGHDFIVNFLKNRRITTNISIMKETIKDAPTSKIASWSPKIVDLTIKVEVNT